MARPYPGIRTLFVCASGRSKPPFGGPGRALEYLGRYTHRVAIDNRRFLLHALPPGFARIRHYGLFAGRTKKRNLARCRELLGVPVESPLPTAGEIQAALQPEDVSRRCPFCHVGIMVRIGRIAPPQPNTS